MRFLARYLMQGPGAAFMTVAGLSVLTLWFAPIGFLLGAAIALVTLRVGVREGLQVMAVSALVHLALAWMTAQSIWPAVIGLLEFMLPAWLLAWALRQRRDMSIVVLLSVWLGGLLILTFHMVLDDPVQWWQQVLSELFAPAMQQAQVEVPEEAWNQLARMATGMLGMSMVILWTSMVLFGRWWQSVLYAPGQFQKDFHQLRLPRSLAWVIGLLALGGLLTGPTQPGLLADLFSVLAAGLMFHGLAVVHAIVHARGMSSAWLVTVYVLLLLIPQMILILALTALFDMWFDLRQRYATPSSEEEEQ